MTRHDRLALTLFAMGLAGLGILALVFGDFALVWQPVPGWVPGRSVLAYSSGVLMLCCGLGLMLPSTVVWAVRILLAYLFAWTLLKLPPLIATPWTEGPWLGFGELAVLLSGGWILFARFGRVHSGSVLAWMGTDRGIRAATTLFGLWLIPIGLSHLVYLEATARLVPRWLPGRTVWAALTGLGQISCGLGVVLSILPRVAALTEAAMLSLFTVLVWVPLVVANPAARLPWTALFVSWTITAAAWAMAFDMAARRRHARATVIVSEKV